jgi:hypothetical protein
LEQELPTLLEDPSFSPLEIADFDIPIKSGSDVMPQERSMLQNQE